MLTVLTQETLESDGVLVTHADAFEDPEADFLTEAVCESLEQVKDTLRELHDYLNGRWDEIRGAKDGAR